MKQSCLKKEKRERERERERENCEFASYELIILRYVTSTKAISSNNLQK